MSSTILDLGGNKELLLGARVLALDPIIVPGAPSATFAGVPSTGTVGVAITGVSVTVTNGPLYGVWVLAGVEQGARVQLVNGGNAIASFTPSSAGGLDYALYSAMTGGTPIATSGSITVAASPPGGAQTVSNVPANQPWYVTAGLSGYVRQPYFYVGVNGGPPISLPQSAVTFTPSTGNPTSAVVRMPGQAPGTYTFLLLTDQGDRVTINATMVLGFTPLLSASQTNLQNSAFGTAGTGTSTLTVYVVTCPGTCQYFANPTTGNRLWVPLSDASIEPSYIEAEVSGMRNTQAALTTNVAMKR